MHSLPEVKSIFRAVKPAAAPKALTALATDCGGVLPQSYLKFLAESDGAESCVHDRGGDCLSVWSTNDVIDLNQAYEIPRYLPELLAIGSDGGDCAIGFDRAASSDPEQWAVVRIGFGNLDRADFVVLARSFEDWWAEGFRLKRHQD